MSAHQNPNTNTAASLTFDHISKHFSLPLNDAASNLGVCTSVLKKICRDNGLDRWPYRKSVEEITRYAARERYKELAELSKVGRESGAQKSNNDMSKLKGSKNVQTLRPQALLSTSLTKGIAALDEFKYGFPSHGLSTASNKWWGSSSPDGCEATLGDGVETNQDDKHQSQEMVGDGPGIIIFDKEECESVKEGSNIGPQGTGLLMTVRKRTVEEGREALKLGVFRGYGINKISKREKTLLLRIFKSSLPKRWIHGSS
uniref:RWP-RK domain-containing protein n=1 Tax=Fagus sylvatica TaxID=28930 RepID=A0A2N9IBC2_FAGSY